jgi:hypothetical protein
MLVREVKVRGLLCHLSSNLNIPAESRRTFWRRFPTPFVSRCPVSHQPVYQLGHSAGDIEKVKRNMVLLAEAKATTGAATAFEVFYHRYKHNVARWRRWSSSPSHSVSRSDRSGSDFFRSRRSQYL